jgi:flavin-dependent dehydrogenase
LTAIASAGFDVAVVGGGPAGSATAIGLARAGLDVVVIEATSEMPLRIGETLPPRVRLALEALDLWDAFAETRPRACSGRRSAWGRAEPDEVSTIFDPYGPGWHVDRRQFDRMLLDAAARAGAEILEGTRVGGAGRADGRWRLDFAGRDAGRRLTSAMVVDATGRRAAFARRHGGARRVALDRLTALVLYLETPARLEDDTTLIEAVKAGWWYSATIPGERIVAALMTDSEFAARRTGRDAWPHLLAAAPLTAARLAGCRALGVPSLASAASARLDPVAGDGWLAVGDAAATVDPLSSGGVDTALRSALDAVAAIAAALRGDARALAAYGARRGAEYAGYVRQRRAYYALERRWPDHPFWRRRAARAHRSQA